MSEPRITRKDVVLYGGAVGGGLVVGGAAVAGVAAAVERGKKEPAQEGVPIAATFADELPVDDPDASAWDEAGAVVVPLLPQQIVQPHLKRSGVAELHARALQSRRDLAFLLEWEDAEPDDLDGIRRYHDAVAVQLPTRAGAAPALTMGAPGDPVHLLQWRATWQRDLDQGATGVDQIYPAVVHDVMPDDVLPPATAQLYWVGREAGNPLSETTRTTPVEEIVAEGFGTVTHLSSQTARGFGIHEDGRWRVIVSLPKARTGVGAPLAAGTSWPVAFAVWLGSQDNRGGRKHISNWQTLVLEAAS